MTLDEITVVREKDKQYRLRNGDRLRKRERLWSQQPDVKAKKAARDKAYREAHPEIFKERNQKIYASLDKDKVKANYKAWYEGKRDHVREHHRQYRAKNREAVREYKRAYNAAHHAEIIEQRRIYRAKNRDKLREQFRQWSAKSPKLQEWYERNADKLREQAKLSARRRLFKYRESFREWVNNSTPRKVAIMQKWILCGELCYICGLRVEQDHIEADHILPRAKGGTNDIQNLMPSHRKCNRSKSARLDYPIARPDLIEAVVHVEQFPRNLDATKKRRPGRWTNSKTRRQMIEEGLEEAA